MRDKGMASSWYQRAADSGNAAAQVSLDGRYALGDGVTQDQGVALMWFNAATSRGSADAKKGINKIAPVMPPPRTSKRRSYQRGIGSLKQASDMPLMGSVFRSWPCRCAPAH